MRRARGLVQACHPLPSLAVTAFGSAYGVLAAGLGWSTVALLAAALFTGQLSVGWSNDALDTARDGRAARRDKPIPAGLVSRRTVWVGAVTAALACAILSFALGVTPGAVHVAAVASAWSYNWWVKTTIASPLPYLVSFALLPAVATTAAAPPAWPDVSVLVAGASLGVAAHFANTVGDTAADALTGVRGLPQRIGPRASMVVMAGFVALTAAVMLIGPLRPGPVGSVVLLAGAVLAVMAATATLRRGAGPAAFRTTLLAVALVVGGFLASG